MCSCRVRFRFAFTYLTYWQADTWFSYDDLTMVSTRRLGKHRSRYLFDHESNELIRSVGRKIFFTGGNKIGVSQLNTIFDFFVPFWQKEPGIIVFRSAGRATYSFIVYICYDSGSLTLLLAGLSESAIALSLRRYYFLIRAHGRARGSRGIEVKNVYKRSAYGHYAREFARRIGARCSPAAYVRSYLRTDRLICSHWEPVCPWKSTIWRRI